MRNLLLVLYGDVVRDDVSGVDMSKCDSMKNYSERHGQCRFFGSRRCIRAKFGPRMRGKKMNVKVLVCVGGNDGTISRWGI